MNPSQLINQTSGNVEYYTPAPIIEAARATMGGIDLDPASSLDANLRVQAAEYFSENALDKPWYGRVWMNHPFGRKEPRCEPDCQKDHAHHSIDFHGNAAWIRKLIEEGYAPGNVTQACCITFACTSESWFKPLLYFPQCFLVPRTNYLLPDGNVLRGVTKGSVVTYLGPNINGFKRSFSELGVVKV